MRRRSWQGRGTFRAVAALTAALAGIPAMAQQSPGVADFLSTIGGDTDIKTSRSLRTRPSPQVFPLLDDADEITGYRYFSEKITANGSATAERARDAFAQEAEQKRREAFRRDLAIGTVTNCGKVIQIRGPMIKIAVPPTTLTPTASPPSGPDATRWRRPSRRPAPTDSEGPIRSNCIRLKPATETRHDPRPERLQTETSALPLRRPTLLPTCGCSSPVPSGANPGMADVRPEPRQEIG